MNSLLHWSTDDGEFPWFIDGSVDGLID